MTKIMCYSSSIFFLKKGIYAAKGLVAELTPPHVQSAWGSRRGRVQAAGLAACYLYF